MLLITRRKQQRIFLTLDNGQRVEIRVMHIDEGTVKLGFIAPPDVQIDREELWRAKHLLGTE